MKNKNKQITKVDEANKNKRIIKRSWWKIVIIISIIVVLITGLGVGLWFLLKPKPISYSDVAHKMNFNTSIEKVRDDILDKGEDIGIFFYEENEDVANFLMLNTTDSEGDSVGIGVLAEYINTTSSERVWYGIKIPSKNELLEILLTYEIKDNEYVFYDQYEDAANGTETPLYIVEADGDNKANGDENLKPDEDAEDYFRIGVKNNKDEKDNPRDILLSINSSETTEGKKWESQSGSVMMFDGETSRLQTFIQTWTTSNEDVDNYNEFYLGWLEWFDNHLS
ncbi:MAG: hypothetical protein HRS50_00505 [Mycoplasmataceae bacterium]|nr:hypothetical protein [Mycoplasmataceae bacterium]